MLFICRANEWQGSSPLAGKGQKNVRSSLSLHARGELHCDSHPELLLFTSFNCLLLMLVQILLFLHCFLALQFYVFMAYIYHKALRSKSGYPSECAQIRTMFEKLANCHF